MSQIPNTFGKREYLSYILWFIKLSIGANVALIEAGAFFPHDETKNFCTFLVSVTYTVKKVLQFSRPQPGSIANLNYSRPGRV
jgi:hypothetical protein